MAVFEITIALLLVGALLAALARRVGAPFPAFLAVAGAGLALVPGTPQVALSPDLVLTLFVAPTLLDAAYDASPRDLRDNWMPITGGAVVAVVLTIAAVAGVARWLRPDMPLAVAIVLGAIVAPPDASAATAVLRALRPPHRVMVILEGESLLNDATALLVYRVALSVVAGSWAGWSDAPWLALSLVGGVVLGLGLGKLVPRLMARIEDVPTSVIFQFIGTFAVWIVANRLALSPIVTMVCYAMTVARSAPLRTRARWRIQSYAVWEVAVFVLNVLAFILIGLQLRPILAGLRGDHLGDQGLFAAAVLIVTIVTRVVWVMGYNTVVRWKNRRFGPSLRRPMMLPTAATGAIIAWCGMRGIVTLATALALPDGSPASGFPFRDLILLSAFAVVLGTLVVQGLTLRPLMQLLPLPRDDQVHQEIRHARNRAAEAALAALDENGSWVPVDRRAEYARRGEAEEAGPECAGDADPAQALRRRALGAERRTIAHLRQSGEIGDDAFHVLEEELDWLEMYIERRLR